MVLNVGLTGGIGSGKSAASQRLAALGAIIVDADKLAREVVEPGTPGLQAIVEAFGDDVRRPDGALDRPKLASIVFNDEQARGRLNAIVHPAVRARSSEIIAAAGEDAIIINDIPLLAEGTMAPSFHLVIVVETPASVRLERLVEQRGMPLDDAKARIASQASDEQRRAIADVLLDNSGTPDELTAQIERVWSQRLAPYAANLAAGRAADATGSADPNAWRLVEARLRAAVEPAGGLLSHNSEGFDIEASDDDVVPVRTALARAGWFGEGSETYRSADPECGYRVRALWNESR